MLKLGRRLLIVPLVGLGTLLLYLTAALIGALVPVNPGYLPARVGIDVYLRSNGVHTDLILPLRAADVDWTARVPFALLAPQPGVDYLAFGWGDRSFYLNTPNWADLKVSTALVALSGFDASIMHVETSGVPPAGPRTRHLRLSIAQYDQLAAYIAASFRRAPQGTPAMIAGALQ